jgi:hypothetical protein
MKMSFHAGQTEWTRFGVGLEFIGGWKTHGLVLTFLWWFAVLEVTVG